MHILRMLSNSLATFGRNRGFIQSYKEKRGEVKRIIVENVRY